MQLSSQTAEKPSHQFGVSAPMKRQLPIGRPFGLDSVDLALGILLVAVVIVLG